MACPCGPARPCVGQAVSFRAFRAFSGQAFASCGAAAGHLQQHRGVARVGRQRERPRAAQARPLRRGRGRRRRWWARAGCRAWTCAPRRWTPGPSWRCRPRSRSWRPAAACSVRPARAPRPAPARRVVALLLDLRWPGLQVLGDWGAPCGTCFQGNAWADLGAPRLQRCAAWCGGCARARARWQARRWTPARRSFFGSPSLPRSSLCWRPRRRAAASWARAAQRRVAGCLVAAPGVACAGEGVCSMQRTD
jgi:hypothetical protein